MIKFILLFGVIRFIIDVAVHQGFYHSKYIYEPRSGTIIFMLQMFLTIMFVIFSVMIFKKKYDGYKDFGHLFILIFGFLVFSEILGIFYDYWFHYYYDPDFLVRYIEIFKHKFPEYGRRLGYTEQEIKEFFKNEYPKMVETAKKTPTYMEIIKGRLISGTIQGFFIGGIIGFIMRDKSIREFV